MTPDAVIADHIARARAALARASERGDRRPSAAEQQVTRWAAGLKPKATR